MKHLKMLGLAAIAALGLMAFVGAGTASATTLATDVAGTIHYEAGTVIHSTLKPETSALLETTGGAEIATCTGSTVQGKLEDPVVETAGKKFVSGTWITGAIEKLTWEGCNQTTDNVNLGSLEIMQIGTEDRGEVRSKGSNVTLGVFGVSCTYGTGEGTILGNISGGEAPVLTINAILARSAGNTLLCPASGRWTATYIVTSPHTVHIVS
jgi:hypothetical protein